MDIIQNTAIIFVAIFLETLPFLIFGALISSVVERYISDEMIVSLIPKNVILGSITGIFLGFFLPACDCAVIPVSKRLIKKKVPVNVAVSFMLASPIINPVVLLSTYTAFYLIDPSIFYLRVALGIVIALVIGIIMGLMFKDNIIKDDNNHHHCCHHDHSKKCFKNDIIFILKHACTDLFGVLKFLILGAIIASLVQTVLPKDILLIFSDHKILSIITLMVFGYLISLCSTSDSFVGKSLLNNFSKSSVVAYLLLGPMIDVKNTFVLFGNYSKKFVITLISLIFIMTFLSVMVVI